MTQKQIDPELQKAIDTVLDAIRDNVKELMQTMIDGPNKPKKLAEQAKVGKGTIQRVLGGSKGAHGQKKNAIQIDTLMRLAWFFNVPYTGLLVRRDKTSIVLGNSSPAEGEPSPKELKTRGR